MRIRILDRILVAVAGILLITICAGVAAQVFFGQDVLGFVGKQLSRESTTAKIVIGICAAVLLLLGVYCVLMLFRHRSRKDKFILQKMESGDLAISLNTLETMVRKCLDQHPEIKTEQIRLENQRDGLLVRVRGTVAGGISIPLTVDTLQKQIKQYVTACSGVEVKNIRIQVEASGEDVTDAPFAIDAPGIIRLSKGEQKTEQTPAETTVPEEKPTGEKESAAEPEEKTTPESAVSAAMAAAASMIEDAEMDDDRPLHQRLFSVQEAPCIMPLPPEDLKTEQETACEETESGEKETEQPFETPKEAAEEIQEETGLNEPEEAAVPEEENKEEANKTEPETNEMPDPEKGEENA